MIYLAIGWAVVALVALARLHGFKREIRRITKQLSDYNLNQTDKMIDLHVMDQDLEALAGRINQQMDLTKQTRAEKRRTEDELKVAIANMSHDLRTPMTSILGYIQLLEADDSSSVQGKQHLSAVRSSALRLKALLEDFFELSRIEAPDYPVNWERVRLNQLTIEVLTSFYEPFHQRGIAPVLELPEQEVTILADHSAVKRVLENLVLNALTHSTGQVAIRLETLPSSVQLTVQNPVTDLREQDIHFLFDRFYKSDNTRAGKGAGLGLSIVKSLMSKMHGSVKAELHDGELSIVCEWKSTS